ncbi:prepilin-type N-terminal cleavage/methylation domain-containing protein [Vulcanococcus limneticus]|uniref:prepilin-type N-terminal cleavage/methylation domain-containing protein n=1 Tax=Vulcanococcus limneticus TaxID=2170428 RepID=UPI00398BDDCA
MKRWRSQPQHQAFSLVELLVVVAVGGIALAATVPILVGQIRVTRSFYSSGQVRQDLSRLHRFLLTETSEACAFQVGSTSLTSCGAVCVATGSNELRLLVPITASVNDNPAAAANLRTIVYRLSGTQLLRTGPRILSSGALDTNTANNQTDTLVIDNVNTFTPAVSSDCNVVTLSIRLNVPGTAATVPPAGSGAEVFSLRAGSRIFN